MLYNLIVFFDRIADWAKSLEEEIDRKDYPNAVTLFVVKGIECVIAASSIICFLVSLYYFLSLDKGTFQLGLLWLGYTINAYIVGFLYGLGVVKLVMVEKEPEGK